MANNGIRSELRDDGKVWYCADEPAPDGRVYHAEIILVCPRHQTEMLLRGLGPVCYCPADECDLEVLFYMHRHE